MLSWCRIAWRWGDRDASSNGGAGGASATLACYPDVLRGPLPGPVASRETRVAVRLGILGSLGLAPVQVFEIVGAQDPGPLALTHMALDNGLTAVPLAAELATVLSLELAQQAQLRFGNVPDAPRDRILRPRTRRPLGVLRRVAGPDVAVALGVVRELRRAHRPRTRARSPGPPTRASRTRAPDCPAWRRPDRPGSSLARRRQGSPRRSSCAAWRPPLRLRPPAQRSGPR